MSVEVSQSIDNLYRNHHSWLYQFLYRKLNNRSDAADLAQDTFIKLLHKQANSQTETLLQPRAFLTTIANGLVCSLWRRQSIEQAYLQALSIREDNAIPSPEQREMIIETLTQLSQVLENLPPRSQQVFLLARLDGMPYRDIAQQLDISVNMVQKAMSRAVLACYQVLYD